MNRNELIKMINEKEKQFQKDKLKRAGLSFVALFVVNFILLGLVKGSFENINISTLGDTVLVAILYTAILFYVSMIIFGQLFDMSRREERHLRELNEKLSKLE